MFGRIVATCEDLGQLAHQVRCMEGDLLGNHAADGKAEHVHLGEAERADEGDRVRAHLRNARRHFAGARGNTCVVEQDDFTSFGQTVGHSRIPIVQRAPEVLVEDDRNALGVAEAAVGETGAVGLHELGRCGLVRIAGHLISPGLDRLAGSTASYCRRACAAEKCASCYASSSCLCAADIPLVGVANALTSASMPSGFNTRSTSVPTALSASRLSGDQKMPVQNTNNWPFFCNSSRATSARNVCFGLSLTLVLALFQALQSQALLLRRVFLAADRIDRLGPRGRLRLQ